MEVISEGLDTLKNMVGDMDYVGCFYLVCFAPSILRILIMIQPMQELDRKVTSMDEVESKVRKILL